MKRFTLRAIALVALVSLPTLAFTDDFSGFRIPDHRIIGWTGYFDGSAWESSNDYLNSRRRDDRLVGNGGSEFRWFSDGDASSSHLFLSAAVAGFRERPRSSGHTSTSMSEASYDYFESSRRASEQWQAGETWTRYIGRGLLGVGVRASVLLDQGQYWANSRRYTLNSDTLQRYEELSENYSRSRVTDASFSLSPRISVGRVRDATGVYLARVVEDRLRRAGGLSRPLTHGARQALTDLLTMRVAYDGLRDRPAKSVWAEIERIARDDGALASTGLGPSSAMRAGEALLETYSSGRTSDGIPNAIVLRSRGASAAAFIAVSDRRRSGFSEYGQRTQVTIDGFAQPLLESKFSPAGVSTSDDTDAGMLLEWHRPVGVRLQLDASAEVSTPLRSHQDGFTTSAVTRATWIAADRWLVAGSVFHVRDVRRFAGNGRTERDRWSVEVDGRVSYEIEDHTAIHLGLQHGQHASHLPEVALGQSPQYDRVTSATLGLTYRFAGRFSAPGFPQLSERTAPPAAF